VDGLVGSEVGLGGFVTNSSYFFKYDWPERVSATSGILSSMARTIVSSSKSVSKGLSVSTSQEGAHTTLKGAIFALLLDFLLVTVVYCWLSTRSRWTYIISPWGVGTDTRPFSCWWCGSVLIILSSPFGMETTPAGVGGWFLNWRNDVMFVVTFFCSGQSLSTSASIKAWRYLWRCNSSWEGAPASYDTSDSWDCRTCWLPQDI